MKALVGEGVWGLDVVIYIDANNNDDDGGDGNNRINKSQCRRNLLRSHTLTCMHTYSHPYTH